jgi:hypothetical protein
MAFKFPFEAGCDDPEGCDRSIKVIAAGEVAAAYAMEREGWKVIRPDAPPSKWRMYCPAHKDGE